MKRNNIILIQPLGLLNKPDPFLCASFLEPITLQYLAASLEKQGFSTGIKYGKVSKEEIEASISKLKPIAICFSIFTYTLNQALYLAKHAKLKAKKLGYNLFTIFGGYHVSAMPMEVISKDEVDFIITGEGDITLCELINSLQKNKNPLDINGLYLKKNGQIIKTSSRERITDLDSIPWAKRQEKFFIHAKNYQLIYPPPSKQISVARISYSRGCPFACTYCASKSTWGNNVTWRSAKDVIDEIQMLHEKYNTNLLSFLDLTFNANKNKVLEICDEFIKRGLPVYWWGLFRPDLLDEEMLTALSRAKCVKLNIGLESPNENLAGDIKTSFANKKDKILKNLNIANDLGILLKAFIIIGFPNETKEQILSYPEKLQEYPIDELRVTFATPYPQTSFWDECIKNKLISEPFQWDEYTTEQPVIDHPSITKNELIKIREKLVSSFYLSDSFKNHLKTKIKNYPYLKEAFIEYFNFLKDNNVSQDKIKNLINKIHLY